MAKNEQIADSDEHLRAIAEAVKTRFEGAVPADKANEQDIESPSVSSELKKLLNERRVQRGIIFRLSIILTVGAFLFLLTLIAVQAILRLDNQSFSFFNGHELEVLSISVFGQVVGIIYIIAKALWDDSNYIDSIK